MIQYIKGLKLYIYIGRIRVRKYFNSDSTELQGMYNSVELLQARVPFAVYCVQLHMLHTCCATCCAYLFSLEVWH